MFGEPNMNTIIDTHISAQIFKVMGIANVYPRLGVAKLTSYFTRLGVSAIYLLVYQSVRGYPPYIHIKPLHLLVFTGALDRWEIYLYII